MAPQHRLVSETELAILKVLWDLGEGTVREVLDARSDHERDWAYTTAQTLLNRLVEKGFVESRKQGRAFLFRPTVSRDELLGQSLTQLADSVCDGASLPLLLNLVHSAQFTPKDIVRFRKLLDELEGEDGSPEDGSPKEGGR